MAKRKKTRGAKPKAKKRKPALKAKPLIPRLNWSTLKLLHVSPKFLRYRVDHPRPDTDALLLGRAIHCLLLEPKEFGKRWISTQRCSAFKKNGEPCTANGFLYHGGKWYCKITSHAPAVAGAPPKGVEVISADGMELAKTCAQAVKDHKIAWGLLSRGMKEHRIEWRDKETGILCRVRVDVKGSCITDLKSTKQETLRDIVRDAALYLYYGQLAWSHDGAIAAGRIPKDAPLPHIVAVSKKAPYDVAVFQLSKSAYQAGQIFYEGLLRKYAQCQAADWWPGIAPDLQVLDLPPWAPGMQGSEEGLSDDF